MISFFFSFDSEPATDQPLSFPNSFEDITQLYVLVKEFEKHKGGGGWRD